MNAVQPGQIYETAPDRDNVIRSIRVLAVFPGAAGGPKAQVENTIGAPRAGRRGVMGLREDIADTIAWTGPNSSHILESVMEAVEDRLAGLEAKAREDYSDDPWDHGYLRALKDMRGEQ